MRFPRLLLALLLAAAPAAGGDMYEWKDKDGVLHVGSRPPEAAAGLKVEKVKSARVSVYDAPSSAGGKLDRLQGPAAASGVELFTTSWCPYCVQAKKYLKSRGIPYQEHNVETDAASAARARGLGWTGGVPFALINGRPVRGFSESAYDSALSKN